MFPLRAYGLQGSATKLLPGSRSTTTNIGAMSDDNKENALTERPMEAATTVATLATSEDCVIPSLRFPQKLWRIVNECKTGAISWGSNGLTVIISYKSFHEEYLGGDNSIFKTTNIASFIRQLNLYGFRKVTSHNRDLFQGSNSAIGATAATAAQDDVHEFLHEHFKAGRLDLLSRVCRKTGVKKNLLQAKPGNASGKHRHHHHHHHHHQAMPAPEGISNVEAQQIRTNTGMSRLQMCQIALTKALEQATRQYRKEKFWLQLSNENVPKDALKPKYKAETLEPNIQIIFQDLSKVQNVENLPIIDASSIENTISYQGKIQWEEIFTIPTENSVSITVPY